MPEAPVALSPIQPVPPTEIRDGWVVSKVHSHAELRIADRTPLTKVLVRASPHGGVAAHLGVPFGRARRREDGVLVIGSGPDEWLLLSPPQTFSIVTASLDTLDDDLVSVLDLTHGQALIGLSGAAAHDVLAKVCAVDLADAVTPNGAAFRSSVETSRGALAMARSPPKTCASSSPRVIPCMISASCRISRARMASRRMASSSGRLRWASSATAWSCRSIPAASR